MNTDNYLIILAGGQGRRLWPASRTSLPKQFLDFFGMGRTQLQSTFDRFRRFISVENIIVCTNRDYASLVREQLPELPSENILSEPVHRGTAASVAYGTLTLHLRGVAPMSRIVVSPADQLISREADFERDILAGLDYAAANPDMVLSTGVPPTRPEPGYGYIQMGDTTGTDGVFRVQSFTEKPEREFARMFINSGEFLWNTGLYFATLHRFGLGNVHLFPDVSRRLQALPRECSSEQIQAMMDEVFPMCQNISVDHAVFELGQEACVLSANFGWADLGTWHSVYECLDKVEGDNVIVDSTVILEGCKGNVIKLPKGMLGVISSMEGYIVAADHDVLYIAKKSDNSNQLKKQLGEIRMKYGEEYM